MVALCLISHHRERERGCQPGPGREMLARLPPSLTDYGYDSHCFIVTTLSPHHSVLTAGNNLLNYSVEIIKIQTGKPSFPQALRSGSAAQINNSFLLRNRNRLWVSLWELCLVVWAGVDTSVIINLSLRSLPDCNQLGVTIYILMIYVSMLDIKH